MEQSYGLPVCHYIPHKIGENMTCNWLAWIFHSHSFLTKIQGHRTFQVLNISISLYNSRKRGNSPLTHIHPHTNTHSSVPCALYHLFLALCFEVSFPSGFPFTSNTTMPHFISTLQDHWSEWAAWHMLKPLGGGWQWSATEALQNNHLTIHIIMRREGMGYHISSQCTCARAAGLKCDPLFV